MALRTPSLNLPYLLTDNRFGEVFQELLRGVDALTQASIITRTLSTPPASPTQGASYIVKATGTGSWAGHDKAIATYWGSNWTFYAPVEGWRVWLQDENTFATYDGSAWTDKITATAPVKYPSYAVASLPAGSAGDVAFASNGRKNGEGAGLGTGVLAFHDGVAWCACDTGQTVAA